MKTNEPITRRESLKKLIHVSGSLVLAGMFTRMPVSANAQSTDGKFIIEGLGQGEGRAGILCLRSSVV